MPGDEDEEDVDEANPIDIDDEDEEGAASEVMDQMELDETESAADAKRLDTKQDDSGEE